MDHEGKYVMKESNIIKQSNTHNMPSQIKNTPTLIYPHLNQPQNSFPCAIYHLQKTGFATVSQGQPEKVFNLIKDGRREFEGRTWRLFFDSLSVSMYSENAQINHNTDWWWPSQSHLVTPRRALLTTVLSTCNVHILLVFRYLSFMLLFTSISLWAGIFVRLIFVTVVIRQE